MADLVCPKCGEIFKAPLMEKKRTGLGFTLPGLGRVSCPKRSYEGLHREFKQ